MKAKSFNRGDKVRIVKAFADKTDGVSFRDEMHQFVGTEGVVEDNSYGTSRTACTVSGPRMHWCWPAECLELVVDPDEAAIQAEAAAIIRDAMRYRTMRTARVRINSWPQATEEKLDEALDEYMAKYPGANLKMFPVE